MRAFFHFRPGDPLSVMPPPSTNRGPWCTVVPPIIHLQQHMHKTSYQSPTERIQVWTAGSALHICFNNPARHNALSADMWQAVPALLSQAEADEAVRLVVFSGAGQKAFVSGADITQFEDLRAAREAVEQYEAMAEAALASVQTFPKPTIACIRGYCIGAGLNLAISCDLRLASDDAVFSIPAARLGLGYRYSALKNLVDLIGVGAAKDLFLTARKIQAEEALALGLITRRCAAEQLGQVLQQYADSISDNAPLTLAAGKFIMAELAKPSPEVNHARCTELILDCFASEDYAEGRRAFLEKRKPSFRGE